MFITNNKNKVLDKVWPLSISQQALCNWSEIGSHPGLVMSMTLLSNNPVILMLLPDKILYQEIKLMNNQGAPSKAKIQDMVAIRHPSGSGGGGDESSVDACGGGGGVETSTASDELDENEGSNEKTTMILLCDDGSLKIYVADQDKTEFWLQPHLRPMSASILQPQQQAQQLVVPASGATAAAAVKSASSLSSSAAAAAQAAWLTSGLLWNLLPNTIMENAKNAAAKKAQLDAAQSNIIIISSISGVSVSLYEPMSHRLFKMKPLSKLKLYCELSHYHFDIHRIFTYILRSFNNKYMNLLHVYVLPRLIL